MSACAPLQLLNLGSLDQYSLLTRLDGGGHLVELHVEPADFQLLHGDLVPQLAVPL